MGYPRRRGAFRPCRQLHRDGRALVRAFLHPNGAAVEIGDLPHQRKSQSRAAVLAAAGFVYPEEGTENAPLIFLRNAAAGVGNANDALFLPLCKLDPHRAAEAVVFDSVLRQVEEHAVDQRVAAGHDAVAIRRQRDAALICQRREVCEDFLDHGRKLDPFVPRHLLQVAHFQQCFCHLSQPLRLLTQKCEEFRRLRPHIGMLRGKQLQLRLHQRQRRAQLVGGVAGELPLGGKGVIQPLQHLVERAAQLPELRKHIFIDPHMIGLGSIGLSTLKNGSVCWVGAASGTATTKRFRMIWRKHSPLFQRNSGSSSPEKNLCILLQGCFRVYGRCIRFVKAIHERSL